MALPTKQERMPILAILEKTFEKATFQEAEQSEDPEERSDYFLS